VVQADGSICKGPAKLLLDWTKNFAGNSEALKDSSAISFGLALLLSQQTSCGYKYKERAVEKMRYERKAGDCSSE
jgi:hypothetical protein